VSSSTPRYIQGIQIISVRALPDRFRSVFHFPNFNAVQSKSFDTVFRTNNNFVLSAPTGSGKTAIFELAICRLIHTFPSGQFKIVYQAPTKSLCGERQRDWDSKFATFDMKCAELTGDTEQSQMKNVQNASIIIATPEKWDSVTRKWKDHAKLMQLVKLFLIDEVHVLKEQRGATLEAVVSRMKSVGSNVRFIAMSATVPNSEDIAEWLGRDPMNQDSPANQERFGEEFRPVLLQKHVCGYRSTSNDWALNRVLDNKLPEIITKYSQKKPIMVFCCTRKDTACTARTLAAWWSEKTARERYWEAPLREIQVSDQNLKGCVASAVAFHHAGLEQKDREAVEDGFLKGNINVICCTSTLAVGVNLPCHFVIVKNTVTYGDKGLREYSDLEIMQMVGRAGRPQFDKSAVAVIMTRQEKTKHYELMVSGQEILESRLHRNLIEHLNAEIGLGTIKDLSTARKWLRGTFLFVRMQRNPEHYRLDGESHGDMDQHLEQICRRDISLLQNYKLIDGDDHFKSTEYGDAMARYCIQFETAKSFLNLPPKAKPSEILSAISQAVEFKDIRFRPGEKQAYRDLNKSPMIKFPIPINLDNTAHKVSLVIQSQLGAVDLPIEESKQTSKGQFLVDVNIVFQHVHRLIRCIIDFLLCSDDSIALRNALMLCRSLGGRCWDDSPLAMRQVEAIGPAAVRKLVNANIRSVEQLANSAAHKIEMTLGRHPPFGMQTLQKLKNFPILRVDITIIGRPIINAGQGATVTVKADIGFMNEKPPEAYRQSPIYLIFLAETSNGQKVHFARISARKVGNGRDMKFAVTLINASQSIICHVMCEDLAGTMKSASVKPSGIPSVAWPTTVQSSVERLHTRTQDIPGSVEGRELDSPDLRTDRDISEDFGVDSLQDDDLLQAAQGMDGSEFQHIDSILEDETVEMKQTTTANSGRKRQQATSEPHRFSSDSWQPVRLRNGNWACNHICKDKSRCKHSCCGNGLAKPPKPPKDSSKSVLENNKSRKGQNQWNTKANSLLHGQTELIPSSIKKDRMFSKPSPEGLQQIDLTQRSKAFAKSRQKCRAKELKALEHLHSIVQHGKTPSKISLPRVGTANKVTIIGGSKNDLRSQYAHGANVLPLENRDWRPRMSPSPCSQPKLKHETTSNVAGHYTFDFEGSDSVIEDVMVGLADSQALRSDPTVVQYEADSRHELVRINEGMDDDAELYDAPAILPSDQPSDTDTPPTGVPDRLKPFSVSPDAKGIKEAASASDLLLPTTVQKRKANVQELLNTDGKKNRFFDYTEKNDDSFKDTVKKLQFAEQRKFAGNLADDQTSAKEAIDPWILQEFGKYVDFV